LGFLQEWIEFVWKDPRTPFFSVVFFVSVASSLMHLGKGVAALGLSLIVAGIVLGWAVLFLLAIAG
jgi:hypothetical protein